MTKKWMTGIILTVAVLLAGIARNPQAVEAGTKPSYCRGFDGKIESGKRFHFGDLVTIEMKASGGTFCASEVKAAYASDNPDVIAVGADGRAETKAPGRATVTVSYQGKKAKSSIEVVAAGTLTAGREEDAAKLAAAGEKLSKKLPSRLTAENGYAMLKAVKAYINSLCECDYSEPYIFLYGEDDKKTRGNLMAPEASCFRRAYYMMFRFAGKYHPLYEKRGLRSVSGNKDKITLTFRKKITDKALLALYFTDLKGMDDEDGIRDGSAKITFKIKKNSFKRLITLNDIRGKHGFTVLASYAADMVFKKGSRTVTVKPAYVKKNKKLVKKKNLKLKKGHTYKMFYWDDNWMKKVKIS